MKSKFNCFSWNLTQHLMSMGHQPEALRVHDVTNKAFWIFNNSPELDQILKEWTKNKTK